MKARASTWVNDLRQCAKVQLSYVLDSSASRSQGRNQCERAPVNRTSKEGYKRGALTQLRQQLAWSWYHSQISKKNVQTHKEQARFGESLLPMQACKQWGGKIPEKHGAQASSVSSLTDGESA